MYCIKCGAMVDDSSTFCSNCGASLAPAQSAVSGEEPHAMPAEKKKQLAMIAATTVAAVAIVAMFLIMPAINRNKTVVDSTQNISSEELVAANTANDYSSASVNQSFDGSAEKEATTSSDSSSVTSVAASSDDIAQSKEYILPDSDTRQYDKSDFSAMDLHDLYLARNEIYARKGRMFKNEDLQSYFSGKSWYSPRYTPDEFQDSYLNDYERSNANLMLEVEKERNSPYLTTSK